LTIKRHLLSILRSFDSKKLFRLRSSFAGLCQWQHILLSLTQGRAKMATGKSKSKTAARKSSSTLKSKLRGRSPRPIPTAASGVAAKKPASAISPAPSASKQSAVLKMLHEPKGTTIADIMKATDWQQHSVRGFFAGIIKKKLALNLVSAKVDGQRIYRIGKSGAAR
jgi:hypothetical protein